LQSVFVLISAPIPARRANCPLLWHGGSTANSVRPSAKLKSITYTSPLFEARRSHFQKSGCRTENARSLLEIAWTTGASHGLIRIRFPPGDIETSIGADARVCPLFRRTRGCALYQGHVTPWTRNYETFFRLQKGM